jgi:hypothetical protein
MDATANLQLPYLAAAQAQKHVTVNETIRTLDALVQLAVVSATTSAQPGSPADGDRYILPAGKAGDDWGSMTDWSIAYYVDGAWSQLTPREGFAAYIADTDDFVVYDGAAWNAISSALVNDSVTNAILRNSAALSVMGRSANSSGDPADIAASAASDAVLRESGGVLGFGTVATAGLADDAVTNAKAANMAADTIKGRANGAGAGDPTDLSATQVKTILSLGALEVLSANRTYYVRTDGSDSNTGLANTAGAAFLTIQKAVDTVAGLVIGAYAVTIQVADGTYTGAVAVTGPWFGSGTVSLVGNVATPANCIVSTTSSHGITVQSGGRLKVSGFKITTATSGSCLLAQSLGVLEVNGAIELGAGATYHCQAASQGQITISASYSVTGAAAAHYFAGGGGFIINSGSITVTFTGTLNFSTAFAYCFRASVTALTGMTFTGGAITGTRYSASANAVIDTGAGGASYFPGNVAGSTATGGQYV